MDDDVGNTKTTAFKSQKLLQIDAANEFEKVNGPNVNAKMKIQSLLMHDRFSKAFREGQLDPQNLYAYWLWTSASNRYKLLNSLTCRNPVLKRSPEFRMPTRLCKFKSNETGMFDRGYYKIRGLLPYANPVITPTFMRGREQFEAEEVYGDVDIKRIRYTQEVVNSRIKTGLLSSQIQYGDLANFQYVLDFAIFKSNLYGPLRIPGDWDEYLQSCGFTTAFQSQSSIRKKRRVREALAFSMDDV